MENGELIYAKNSPLLEGWLRSRRGVRRRRKMLLMLLFLPITVFAWNPTPATIEAQIPKTAFEQLSDFQNFARPENAAYLTAGLIYLPLPSQSALKTEYGEHQGFAMRQRLGMWLVNGRFGLGWIGERQGWDNEDFLFFPNRGTFSQINQIHTFGLTVQDSSKHLLLGSGAQYLNAAEESWRWWLLGTWRRLSVFSAFHKGDLQVLNVQLNLQTRALLGYRDSWQNYLPDLEYSYFSKDSSKIFISQNLFKQKLYAEATFSLDEFSSAAIKFYPDPSRLLLALEATATKRDNGDIFFGGGLTLPFLRLAYNSATEYETFFKSSGIFIVELRLSIASSGDSFFEPGATKPAPTQITETPVRKPINEETPAPAP